MARFSNRALVLSAAGFLSAGCTINLPPQYGATTPAPAVAAAPVVTGPGVEVITTEPAPDYRVYVYDPGYPPGVYLYDDYYWYDGYRYPHDIFVNKYVTENIQENRYTNVEENRRSGQVMAAQQRAEYARTGGVHPNAAQRQQNAQPNSAKPAPRPAANPAKK